MRVERITTWPDLEILQHAWNALSGDMPLRSWDWLATWWKFYGPNPSNSPQRRTEALHRELCVLAVYDDSDALLATIVASSVSLRGISNARPSKAASSVGLGMERSARITRP